VNDKRILVFGATGELGGAVARQLLATGARVRAFGRNRAKLNALAALGAEVVAGDLLDQRAVSAACEGVAQVFTSANNVMGSGASSPIRVDVAAHVNICRAARESKVERIVNVSAAGSGGAASPVDFFRVKHQVDTVVRESGIPFVLLAPTVFMETWAGLLIGDPIRAGKPAVLFGAGNRQSNFIAVSDVAEFAVKILQRDEVQNETVEVGGPTTCSFADVVTLVERTLGVKAKRVHVPVAVLRVGKTVLRPFNEAASRKMGLGHFVATHDTVLDSWPVAAKRFGAAPMTLETFIERRFGGTP